MSKKGRGRTANKGACGIPLLFEITQTEKLTAVLSVKVFPSLKKWVHSKGGSAFVRFLIQREKTLEEEGSENQQ